MQVLHEEHERALGGQLLEEARGLLVQPVAGDQRVEPGGDVQSQGEAEDLAPSKALEDALRILVLGDPEVLLDHLGERPVRDPTAVGEAASRASLRGGRLVLEDGPQLADEPRLADAGVAHDRDQMRLSVAPPRAGKSRAGARSRARARRRPRAGPPTPRGRMSVSARTTRRQGTPLALSLASTVCGSSNSNAPRAAATVRSPARISPGAAACSSRAATFTASPVTNELPSRARPTTTSPVLTPIRSWSGGSSRRSIANPA